MIVDARWAPRLVGDEVAGQVRRIRRAAGPQTGHGWYTQLAGAAAALPAAHADWLHSGHDEALRARVLHLAALAALLVVEGLDAHADGVELDAPRRIEGAR